MAVPARAPPTGGRLCVFGGLAIVCLALAVHAQTALDCEICQEVARHYTGHEVELRPECKGSAWKIFEKSLLVPANIRFITEQTGWECTGENFGGKMCTVDQARALCQQHDLAFTEIWGEYSHGCCVDFVRSSPLWGGLTVCQPPGDSEYARTLVAKCLKLEHSLKPKYIQESGMVKTDSDGETYRDVDTFCYEFPKLAKHGMSSCQVPTSKLLPKFRFLKGWKKNDRGEELMQHRDTVFEDMKTIEQASTAGLQPIFQRLVNNIGLLNQGSSTSLLERVFADFFKSTLRTDQTLKGVINRQWKFYLGEAKKKLDAVESNGDIASTVEDLYRRCVYQIHKNAFEKDIRGNVDLQWDASFEELENGIDRFYTTADRALGARIDENLQKVVEAVQGDTFRSRKRKVTRKSEGMLSDWYHELTTGARREYLAHLNMIQDTLANVQADIKTYHEMILDKQTKFLQFARRFEMFGSSDPKEKLVGAEAAFQEYLLTARTPPFSGLFVESDRLLGQGGEILTFMNEFHPILHSLRAATETTGNRYAIELIRETTALMKYKDKKKNQAPWNQRPVFAESAQDLDNSINDWKERTRVARASFMKEVQGLILRDGFAAVGPVFQLSVVARDAAAESASAESSEL